ncbi:MAG TPA: NAD-dependent epimerase/dehydratase family protein [Gammaproteobacteria bacterium]|nr:NAD-dependent epimerase/dehydratase family protein [Gammaproteobacteria bacterium]
MDIKNVLVTGASGFIGRHVSALLALAGYVVRGTGRQLAPAGDITGLKDWVPVRTVDVDTNWNDALEGMNAVVHLAGRAHVMRDRAADPMAEYRRVNVGGAESLARQAAQRGVKRIVFMSSIKVHGEHTGRLPDGTWRRFSETDAPQPVDAYAASKWEAEQVLRRVSHETGMAVAVLRPPLVYGPGVGANFLRLMRMIDLGWPLPFAHIRNLRSLIYVGNLADAVRACLENNSAAGRTYLVRDMDVSTPDLIRAVAAALNRPPRLYGVPPMLLHFGAYLLLRPRLMRRLMGSLVADDALIRNELSWSPPVPAPEALARTASWFRQLPWTR